MSEVTLNLIDEMDLVRQYATLINRARKNAGFLSLKYPITDVKVNHYFIPELRMVLAEECNIVGYMDIPAIEDVFNYGETLSNYQIEEEKEHKVWLSTTRSQWQEDLYQERLKKREEAEIKKQNELCQK